MEMVPWWMLVSSSLKHAFGIYRWYCGGLRIASLCSCLSWFNIDYWLIDKKCVLWSYNNIMLYSSTFNVQTLLACRLVQINELATRNSQASASMYGCFCCVLFKIQTGKNRPILTYKNLAIFKLNLILLNRYDSFRLMIGSLFFFQLLSNNYKKFQSIHVFVRTSIVSKPLLKRLRWRTLGIRVLGWWMVWVTTY